MGQCPRSALHASHWRRLQPFWQAQAKAFELDGLRALRTYHATLAFDEAAIERLLALLNASLPARERRVGAPCRPRVASCSAGKCPAFSTSSASPATQVGRNYTRFPAENARTDVQPRTTIPTSQSGNRVSFLRNNERDSLLRRDYCGRWASACPDPLPPCVFAAEGRTLSRCAIPRSRFAAERMEWRSADWQAWGVHLMRHSGMACWRTPFRTAHRPGTGGLEFQVQRPGRTICRPAKHARPDPPFLG